MCLTGKTLPLLGCCWVSKQIPNNHVFNFLKGFSFTLVQGCKLELKELGNFGQTRTRKIKISELELELKLEKSLWSLSSFNE